MEKKDSEFISFEFKELNKGITIVSFELKRDLEPQDLKSINPPDPVKNKFSQNLVVLSGRGPVWLYGFLTHFYHPVKAVAVFDPRLGSAIVVESHTREFTAGDIINLEGQV